MKFVINSVSYTEMTNKSGFLSEADTGLAYKISKANQ